MLYTTTCVRLRYGCRMDMLSGFSREYDYPRYPPPPEGKGYYQGRLWRWICLPPSAPTPFNGDFRCPAAVSRLRLHVAPCGSDGILTVSAIAHSPFGWDLGPDLPRDDWHCPGNLGLAAGGNLTLLLVTYTYICLTVRSSRGRPRHSTHTVCSPTDTFINCYPASSAPALIPDYYPRADPRLVSCYALFE